MFAFLNQMILYTVVPSPGFPVMTGLWGKGVSVNRPFLPMPLFRVRGVQGGRSSQLGAEGFALADDVWAGLLCR